VETNELGRELLRLRGEAGLSIRGLSERTGLSTRTIVRLEKARQRPTAETLARLAKGLGTRAEPLIRLMEEADANVPLGPAPSSEGEAGRIGREQARGALDYLRTQLARAEQGEAGTEERLGLWATVNATAQAIRRDLGATSRAVREVAEALELVGRAGALLYRGEVEAGQSPPETPRWRERALRELLDSPQDRRVRLYVGSYPAWTLRDDDGAAMQELAYTADDLGVDQEELAGFYRERIPEHLLRLLDRSREEFEEAEAAFLAEQRASLSA
jgi:transcriptional regulator with XRE-family HTH domain